ncbi:MAG: glycosyltransferase family 4 protein [Alphaproteobacteria bacterium]|nr:glycosyltransferase family 4 protein [Alphaproteobacteria bacterium]MCW5738732.1 glycosyltransferase family 4 protein [Alphaproteobacteria bacterium]
MSSLYVAVSMRKNGPQEPITGIPRVEHEIARELVARGGHVLRYDTLLGRFRVAALDSGRGRRPAAKAPPAMHAGDTIFVPAILWRQRPIDDLIRKRRAGKLRLGVYVHDIMPIRRPELVSNENGAADFRRFIDAMVSCADWLCVSSRFVGQDLAAYVRETGKRDIPVHHVPLCADLKDRVEAESTRRLRGLELPEDGYALYVSTLNPRKNHVGMYWLWRRLVAELGDRTPPLVLAGQRGWNDRDVFDLMSRDREMWGRHIRFVDGPSDAELVHLYRHCAFTVFPSHHEGWGLPITESLSFGKPCVAADNTSLREAGQGLATHLDDLDGPGWLAAIKRLALDAEYRRDCSALIAARYQPRTWHNVGEEIFRLAKSPA